MLCSQTGVWITHCRNQRYVFVNSVSELVLWLGFEKRGMNASLELAKSIDEKENKLHRLQFPLLFSL